MTKKQYNECKVAVFTILLIITILFSIAYVTGNIKFFVNLSCCLWVLGLAICLHLEYKTPVKPNGTHPSTPVNKENPEILNKNPSLSPNMSEVEKLINQVELVKNSFKTIGYEYELETEILDMMTQFNLLKEAVYSEMNRIDWANNNNIDIIQQYQTVIDRYIEVMNNEYSKIKEKFDNVMKKDVEDRIKNIQIIQDSK